MPTFRIAHLIANQKDRRSAVTESFVIPASNISPGFSVENVELRRNISTLNDLDRTILELAYAEAGVRAAKAGFDALLVTPFKDYGVREMRAAVDIPVIGGGQSAMQIAAGLGGRFAVVTVYPAKLRGLYAHHISACGFDGHCSGVYFASEDQDLPALVGDGGAIRDLGVNKRGELMDRVEQSARRALQSGADVIVLGCTCMSPIRTELERRLGGTTPVVDPLLSGYKFAELLLALGIKRRRNEPSAHAAELAGMISGTGSGDAIAEVPCGEACALMSDGEQAA